MIGIDATLDAPAAARYHPDAIDQIIQCVDERVYCALLGPRLSGKTLLLRFVEQNLAKLLGWTCIYIDLLDIRATTQQAFFADLIQLTTQRIAEATGLEVAIPDESEASSVVFRAFLADSLYAIERDLVLIIDPLEALPIDLVQALLTSLRAAYMDQQTLDYQVTVIVSGALSLATLAVGESSPFRGIARRIFVGDLSNDDSQTLILELLAEYGVSATRPAIAKLLGATKGDLYLMRAISKRASDLVHSRPLALLRARDINLISRRFLRQEVTNYAPLVEAVRLIEEDPDLLECILMLLASDSMPRSELPLPLSPDLDPLYLTGVVEMSEGECYRLQNSIYRQFLAQHFTPDQVGHVLAMVGRWDSAIDYLEASILQGNRQSRLELLPAAIHSIYASENLAQAVHFLRRALSAGFGVSETRFWYSPPQESHLLLVGAPQASLDGELWANARIPLSADRLEARAYRQKVPLRGQEDEYKVVRAIPLIVPGERPLGVVTIYYGPANDLFVEQRERDIQLAGFLNQAARAFQIVSVRRQELTLAGRMQASLLPVAPPDLPGWQVAAVWKPARETSGDFYDFISLPDGRLGIVIADVVDKGMGAALLMALARTLIRTYAPEYPDHPERLLQIANRRIIADSQAGLFVTMFVGVLDPLSGQLVYCNAGHPPPHILPRKRRQPVTSLSRTGVPLGIADDQTWTSETALVPPGGLLLLYTDGILDAQNQLGELFGNRQMLELVRERLGRPAAEIQDALMSGVFAFAGAEPQVDDITLVVLARGAGAPRP